MDKNREARRVSMAAAGNGLSRRRHRAGSFRDSLEDDGPVEFPEAARLRDRGGSGKEDRDRDRDRDRERERERHRDRLNSGSKRRREHRLMMMRGNMVDGDEDSSEESVNDDEEYDNGGRGGGPPSSMKMLPPANRISTASFSSSLSNHHSSSGNLYNSKSFPPAKVFRSSPFPAAATASPLVSFWKAADEMIGVSVPRKARSASTKRSHESWALSATAGGIFSAGEHIHRHVSTSPARVSPAPMLASPSPPAPPSPSSSSVSVRKKMPSAPKQKSLPPKSSSCKSSSPVAAQDEIEIEIAEVLYGMMRQPLGPSKQEAAVNDSVEANLGAKSTGEVKPRVSSLVSNSNTTIPLSSVTIATNSSLSNVSAIAPKRKRPRPVKYEDESNSALPSRMCSISSTIKAEAEAPSKAEAQPINPEKVSGSTGENISDSTNPPDMPTPPLKAERESKPSLDSSEKKESNLSKEEPTSTTIEDSSAVRSDGDGLVSTASKTNASFPPEKEKFEIDLMARPPARSSPETDGEMDLVAAEAKPKAADVETDAKPRQIENDCKAEKLGCEEGSIQEPEEKKPRTAMESESDKTERNITELKLDLEKSDQNKLNHYTQKQTQQQTLEKSAQTSHLALHTPMPGWPGGLPTMGYMAPTQGVVPVDTSALPSSTMQPPQLVFNQPRPKRCATHCYIARNIHYHHQFTKMNPFWPAAAAAAAGSAPMYSAKACNLSLMPSNSVPDKSSQSTTSNSSDTNQRKPLLLQQPLPPGAPNNILHGPGFILPLGQQPYAAAAMASVSVRPPMSGNTASGAAASSASMNGSASASPAGTTTMSFSYPNMASNETQYLAILQNNGYPFPVPAHVGAPPAYRGSHGQPIPFFNGSFYSSQMIHPPHLQPQQQSGQGHQGQAPSNQNTSVSTGSSAAQKHVQNPQGFPMPKVQCQPLSFQPRQQPRENTPQQSETVGEESPSTADSRASRSNVAYGQNFAMPMQPTNLGSMNSAASDGAMAGSCGNHGEKKPKQQGSKAGVESLQSQAYAMTFATFNGTSAPSFNMPFIPQNHAIFHSIPEAARQGYHQMMAAAAAAAAAKQKMNYNAPEDGKSGPNAAAKALEERKTGTAGEAPTNLTDTSVPGATGNGFTDSSARLLNLSSAPQPRTSSSAQASHQQLAIHLQKQQQNADAAAAAVTAARSKGPVTSNGSVYPDHSISGGKFPNANSGFPQNIVQSNGSPVQSPQWKSNSCRTTTAQVQSPSILSSSTASSHKNVQPKQQGRPQQVQISFAANTKSMPFGPPSTSSVSKNAGGSGSLRTATSASTANKSGQVSSMLTSSQPSKNISPTASVPILGNPHVTHTSDAMSKSQQPPKQAQLFFSSPYMPQQNGYYLQRHQQPQGSSPAATSHSPCPPVNLSSSTTTAPPDPGKAVKGGNLKQIQGVSNASGPPGKTQNQVVPPGFPYVPAADQKQPAGE
ncbi:PREDICTED: protein TIME FOR COFFEE-like isoform X2 [Tarenaya hassleriana]|uniref:protein TIME FOR COFFEE-like isoform X2 n=1 Tax=Tarenaya hassleriana TaxID=28532 RepID=UPI00053C5883|nr:PREDICTED: protein TIME FOR COFFEE-like isoform X2 [Tarenaya hassleriana]